MNELMVLLDGRDVGVVRQHNGRLNFIYDDAWRRVTGAYPLSLSMPLAAAEHAHSAIDPFIWGLLPDNEFVLSRWAKQFQVSPRNAFALIGHVGEDCAGAVQFVTPERRYKLLNHPHAETEWLTDADVANRLRAVRADASAGRSPRDTGQFSLAGAQPKTALLYDGQRWGVPSGRTPTTHILKPPTAGFDGHAENEHLCLRLAQALGLPTANSEVRYFEDVTAIVVERYDRVVIGSSLEKSASKNTSQIKPRRDTTSIFRVHQEDFCQSLRVHPAKKYQNEGGPGPSQIVDVLSRNIIDGSLRRRMNSIKNSKEADISTFVNALIFNWLIGGTDAHAKNYSLLIGGSGMVRLAPLYDVASIFAYPDIDPKKAKLAMKVGDEYRIRYIGLSDWKKLANTIRVDADALVQRLREMAIELPDRLSDEIKIMQDDGLTHRVIDTLAKVLPERAAIISVL
jgi:serine/threonine-protein kinase HipA